MYSRSLPITIHGQNSDGTVFAKAYNMIKFIQLDGRKGTDQITPEEWGRTLGFEVTIPTLAAACGFGNIDGQHGMSGTHPRWVGRAAVEIAVPSVVADADGDGALVLPHNEAVFATVRPDVDSIAAMALTVLRKLDSDGNVGGPGYIPPMLDITVGGMSGAPSPTLARIRLIAERDSFMPGAAWGPRPLPTVKQPWPMTVAQVGETQSLAPLGVICSPFRGQPELPMAERVLVVAAWLLYGMPGQGAWFSKFTSTEESICRIADACGISLPYMHAGEWVAHVLNGAEKTAIEGRLALARAVESGEVRIMLGGRSGAQLRETRMMKMDRGFDGHAVCTEWELDLDYDDGTRTTLRSSVTPVAVVESAHPGAMGLGYCLAPVVIAAMPPVAEGGRKATIAAWRPRLVDFGVLKARLNEAELIKLSGMGLDHGTSTQGQRVREGGWGGSATIIGSPQGDGTVLDLDDEITPIVSECLR